MTLKEQIDLLGWKDITTDRQISNGTRIYRLPIKKHGQYIEVGSFESGYVRRMNGCYTPYQLNKCEPSVEYFKDYKWCDTRDEQYWTGKYNKFVGRGRIKIMSTRKRLQYLITYCLKNYYINQANEIENGNYIPKWKHEYEMKNGSLDKVRELQLKVMKQEKIIREFLEEIDRISEEKDDMERRFESTAMELNDYHFSGGEFKNIKTGETYVHEQHAYWNKWQKDKPSSVEIIIDGHRYKVK